MECLCFPILFQYYGNSIAPILLIVCISGSRKICKKSLSLECFCSPILFPYYRNTLTPCFWDNNIDVKTNTIFYFQSHFQSRFYVKLFIKKLTYKPISTFQIPLPWKYGSMEVYTVQKKEQCLLQKCCNFCNNPLNMAVGIRLKHI